MVVPPTALDLLRKSLRVRRQAAVKYNRKSSFLICPQWLDMLQGAKAIGLYLPMNGEPDPLPLITGYSGVMSLPALSGQSFMTFQRWSPGDTLMASSWGGEQPIESADEILPDLVIVPLLGFDASFNRIGQGGGHYDRYLAAHPSAWRVGLAWEAQRVDAIEAQPWDVPMDAILTEADFYIKDLTRCQRL